MPQDSRRSSGRLQRILAYIAVALIGLSVIAILIVLAVAGTGAKLSAVWGGSLIVFPLIALPLGAICIVALFVTGMIERRRLNPGATK
ncbi:hypothetical protein [Gryllotalpicola ginsengisoli]|uniref:hypothetical protein n=1 Tax=Gryllotalpicola ginsengisoli TaxID=444608 RepID=UPI0012DC0165|nr:hypothetical protein [Gryllotalpicola ginsengisoli]